MGKSMLFVLLAILTAELDSCYRTCAQDICGTVGSRNETRVTERRDRMFYLNTANPAPCNGNITSWRVCYYAPSSISFFSIRDYWATYALYRRKGTGSSERFEQISEMFSALRGTRLAAAIDEHLLGQEVDGIIRSGFHCYTDRVPTGNSPITVRAGDVVGACIFDPVNHPRVSRRQLDVVGEVRGESLQAMDTSGCSLTGMPSTITINTLTNIDSRRLHIYANIEQTSTQVVPTTVSTTVVSTVAQTSSGSLSESSTTIPPTDTTSDLSVPLSTKMATSDSSATKDITDSTDMSDSILCSSSNCSLTSQNAKTNTVAVAIGSTIGILALLTLLIVLIAITIFVTLKRSRKEKFTITKNTAYYMRRNEEVVSQCQQGSCVVTIKENTAYKSLQSLVMLGSNSASNSQERLKELKEMTNKGNDSLNMNLKPNVAYHTTLNVAYKTQKSTNSTKSDSYDYVN